MYIDRNEFELRDWNESRHIKRKNVKFHHIDYMASIYTV